MKRETTRQNLSTVKRTWIVVFASFFALTGCESPSGLERALMPGIISGFNVDDPHVSLTLAGRALTVEVTSYGDGCRSKGEVRASVDLDTRSANVAPFDWFTPGRICTSNLSEFRHSTTFELGADGAWTIILEGDNRDGEPVQFAFSVGVAQS